MNSKDIAILEKIAQGITPEQIGKCTKVYDYQARANVYLVENSKGNRDEHGVIIEYKVQYTLQHGFTCTCPSGQQGFAHCKHRYCWHVRASVAAVIEEVNALAAIARDIEEGRPVKHPLEHPAVVPIEVKWGIPQWMLRKPVAPHMKNYPKELD